MITKEEYLLVFSSTHHALYTEDVLKKAEIEIDVVPVPLEITAECGLAITFNQKDGEKAAELVSQHEIKPKACYFLNEDKKLAEKKDFLK